MIPKFRAWDKETEKVLRVHAIFFDEDGSILDLLCIVESGYLVRRDIKQVEIMQSTGLKDKTGVEIFEGDVLRGEFEYTDFDGVSHTEFCIGAVEYSENRGCYMVDEGKPESDEVINWLEALELKAIGNIYENPDLFEGVEQ